MNKSANTNIMETSMHKSEVGQEFNESGPKSGHEIDEFGHDDDDEEILNTWLGELNTLKKVQILNNFF